ncbi:pyridoxamine 5'-phosphate oxidase family protein [Altererythrobacter arenosus]|uniref:Pyridoxamine 5'-phosphate oxidase family protein n=1 Tax=Altererythrobacter arenosus TaxID=3032592 RepID=A0ABY8FR93_9SPHN|nr:pyridoxamine 5'-phosphate oxidase family protein [Altererythrobacter sp. CAU 1644]WFL77533.1 pyridoxamine 5'-phosphate oxidase family protein [Altererythrobacter sp. CAU 1644]
MFDTLDAVRDDFTRRIESAATDRHLPMHLAVLSTRDADARVLVLRAFDRDSWTLRFHTDVRSPKCDIIAQHPGVGVLLYDRSAKVQLRIRGEARVETDGPVADAAWEQSTNFARRCYLGDGPGTLAAQMTSGLPPQFEGIEPTDEQLIPARPNFAIIQVEMREIDWFFLSHAGHRRAQFARQGEGWEGRWVAP